MKDKNPDPKEASRTDRPAKKGDLSAADGQAAELAVDSRTDDDPKPTGFSPPSSD